MGGDVQVVRISVWMWNCVATLVHMIGWDINIHPQSFAPAQPEGQVVLKMWDKDRWTSDDFLGEIQIDIGKYADGNPHDLWLTLANEPKKKEGAAKGEVHVIITYDGTKKGDATGIPAAGDAAHSEAAPATNGASPAPTSAPVDAKPEKLEDKYEIGMYYISPFSSHAHPFNRKGVGSWWFLYCKERKEQEERRRGRHQVHQQEEPQEG